METISIDIKNELTAFKEHLEINERTILSAKFGDGKTFFLDKFKEEYKNDYEFITIYPVNYQIAENKEIFEYIKRDILIQMVAKNMIQQNYDIPDYLLFQFFVMHNSYSFLGSILQTLPSLGISEQTVSLFLTGYNVLDWSKKLTNLYKKYNNAIKSQDETRIIQTFIEDFSKRTGNPYEIDLITQIIIDNIEWFRNEKGKKIVLIIEDLDRIDPAHLFRILNIFSAHIDRVFQLQNDNTDNNTIFPESLSNKFGVDNIITVFDYSNTRKIFYHFYGQEADYEGYINKFTSHQPFYYSIDEIARQYLYKVISEKCCITQNNIEELGSNFIKKIDALSVRDVMKILRGIDLYIKEECYSLGVEEFSTKSPLTYTIAILKLLGIQQIEEIKQYILNLSSLELLNCVNVFLLIHAELTKKNFKFQGKSFAIREGNKTSNINKIEVYEGYYHNSLPILQERHIKKCIQIAFEYVNK